MEFLLNDTFGWLLALLISFGLGWFISDFKNSLIINRLRGQLYWYKTHKGYGGGE